MHGGLGALVAVPVAGRGRVALDQELARRCRAPPGGPASSTRRASKPGITRPLEPGPRLARPVGDEVVERLRRAHHVEQLEAEARLPGVEERGGQRLPRGDAEPQRGEIEAPLRVLDLEQRAGRRWPPRTARWAARPGSARRRARPRAAPAPGSRRADQRREVERVAEAECEVELGDREDEVVGPDAEGPPPHQLRRVHQVVVQMHRRLGLARSSPRCRARAPRRRGSCRPGPARARPARAAARTRDRRGGGRPTTITDWSAGHRARTARIPRRRVLRRDHGAGAAVLQHERELVGGERVAHRHRHRADLHRAPERLGELGAIRQGQEHALLDLRRRGRGARCRADWRGSATSA